jgi:hypothetical protein
MRLFDMTYANTGRAFERLKAFMAHHNLKHTETAKLLLTPIGTFKHWLTGEHQTPGCLVTLLDILEGVPEARKYLRIEEGKR